VGVAATVKLIVSHRAEGGNFGPGFSP